MPASIIALANPEDGVKKLWISIPAYMKTTFFSACALGLLTHLYMFTQKALNHDDIGALFSSDYGTASGRWFLPFVSNLDGNFSMPWLLGLLSVLALACAACFVVGVMRIRRPLGCILTAALLVTFPVVTATNAYMFSADAYFLALALAAFAAYITNRYRLGFAPGAIAIALAMGIYQSYFAVAAVLMVAALIFDTLDGVLPMGRLLLKGVKLVLTLAAGMALYIIVVKLTTRSVELVNYMGISDMGKLSLSDLPRLIGNAYLGYGKFFVLNDPAAHFSFLKYAFLLTALASVALTTFIVVKKKLKAPAIFLLVALFAVYPLAGNLVYIMVPNAPVHVLMLFGMVGILVAPLALAEYYMALSPARTKGTLSSSLGALCCWVIVGTMALTSYSYAIFANEIYLKLDLTYEQVYSYSSRLLGAIEGTEGYHADRTVVLVGRALEHVSSPPTPELGRLVLTGIADTKEMVNSYTYGYYLRRFHGISNTIYPSSSPLAAEYAASAEVQAMPVYPAAGSIQPIGDYLVVRLG